MGNEKNLDEIYPGLDNEYQNLKNKYGKEFNNDKKILLAKYILLFICAIVFVFISSKIMPEKDFGDLIGDVVFYTFVACLLLPFIRRSKDKTLLITEIENRILSYIFPNIVREKFCKEINNMKDDYLKTDIYNQGYDKFMYNDYYRYDLSDGRLVENVHLNVQKNLNSYKRTRTVTIFNGQFIKIKNKYDFKHRIDIVKDSKLEKIENFIERKNTFESSDFILDSSSFENSFKIFCDNQNYAYQILTADIMELLTEYRDKIKVGFEISLIEDNIYIKINEQLINLYSNDFNNPLDRKTVEYFVNEIKTVTDFMEILVSKLDEKIYEN